MAFTSVHLGFISLGNKMGSYGTFEGDGDNGGDIDTGMKVCEHITLTPYGAAGQVKQVSVDETLPADGHAVTINSGSDVDGSWFAIGY